MEGSPPSRKRYSLELRTGAPWRDLPFHYGPCQTCYDRFVCWRHDGTWDRLLTQAQTESDAVGQVEWLVGVDSTIVRAHQHAAGARREPNWEDAKTGVTHPRDEGLGRSRGGLTSIASASAVVAALNTEVPPA